MILAYAGSEKAAEDVGFYYAANATGRLMGILLSGLLYQAGGLTACLFVLGLVSIVLMTVGTFDNVSANYMVPNITPDKMTGVAIAIEYEHHEIHDGNSYTVHFESPGGALPTNIGEETAIGFTTPAAAAGRIHMTIDVRADDESVWEFREDPVIVLDQELDLPHPLNRFRSSTNTSGMFGNTAPLVVNEVSVYGVVTAAAAGLAGGEILHSETIAIAAGPPFASFSNNVSRGQREWILQPSTEYVVIVTNSTANDTVHEITLNWYEHTDSGYIR